MPRFHSRGLPTVLPAGRCHVLDRDGRGGLRRYERDRCTRSPVYRAIHSPDKEFRYLRMVIVTTAVYWRLSSELRPEELTRPLNVPAPGRRQSVYIVLRLRTDLCF